MNFFFKIHMLDDKQKITQLDSKNMLGSLQLLEKQAEQVWQEVAGLELPKSYKKASNIVVLGMGGSALGSELIKSLYKEELAVPLEIVNHYHVPNTVTEDTLVLASSYSGTTEEVISAAQEARERKAKVMVISSGGALAAWAKTNNYPALVFSTNNNPCGSPRMGLGYSIFGQLALFVKLGFLTISADDLDDALQTIIICERQFGADNPEKNNLAKQMAVDLLNKSVWYFGAEHLSGNAHIAANQMNENAKRFAGYFIVPELNHHLMEGMLFPESNKNNIKFVLMESDLYDERVQKRFAITAQVLVKNAIEFAPYKFQAGKKLGQCCEALVLSSYVSFYSAILQGIDPTAIPFVDFFKAQLKK